MTRLQGLVQKDVYLPERMFNVRVYFLALLCYFLYLGTGKRRLILVYLTQIWSFTRSLFQQL